MHNPMKPLLLLLVFYVSVNAQIRYETRAVWLTTNYGLDWPRTSDPAEQKKTLEEIFDSIKAKNLNTVYFQVRGNGYVLFRSSYEELSPRIAINPNIFVYDPLKYAIKLARERSLELHAWVNVLKVYGTRFNAKPQSVQHLVNKHPEWLYKVVENGITSYWMNPALTEVREYIVKLISELVNNYDVDGVHLDFLRYSNIQINDGKTESFGDEGIGNWRRNNITRLLEEIYYNVKKINPVVEVGVTPIGINKNTLTIRGMEGYNEVYQDAEEWVAKGIVDYLAPQIYWDIENVPKFEDVLNQWLEIGKGVNLVAGIAAYKNEVKSQIEKILEIVRGKYGTGSAFFRYDNIKQLRFEEFNELALPPRRTTAVVGKATQPLEIIGAQAHGEKINLKWKFPDSLKNNVRAYLVLMEKNEDGYIPLAVVNDNHYSAGITPEKFNMLVYRLKVLPLDNVWKPMENAAGQAEIYNYRLIKFAEDIKSVKPFLLRENGKLKIVVLSPGNQNVKIYSKAMEKYELIKQAGTQKGINVLVIGEKEKTEEILILLGGKEFRLKF